MAHNNKDQYELEKVHYCENCLSLNIRRLNGINIDICDNCGNSDVKQDYIEKWNRLYVERYGAPFMDINEDFFDDEE